MSGLNYLEWLEVRERRNRRRRAKEEPIRADERAKIRNYMLENVLLPPNEESSLDYTDLLKFLDSLDTPSKGENK